MARSGSYEELIAHIQELEHRTADLEQHLRATEHVLEQQQRLAAQRHIQLKTLHTLNMGVFSSLREEEIYGLACQSIVHQLGWDAAFVISLSGGLGVVKASYQATEKQLQHLRDYLHQNPLITDAYAHHSSLTTTGVHTSDAQSLALRSLFQTEEVVAHPILFGEHCYGYLVAGAHSPEARERREVHGREDVEFLASMAALLAHAVQQGTSLLSLEEQNQRLRQLDEMKDSFISITSHQLRTPLSIIKWILSILQTDKKLEGMAEQVALVNQAYETNERLIHVVNDLLNVSRIQEGRLPYNPQLTDLGTLVRDLVTNAERLVASKGATINLELGENIPALELDPILFKEAVQNLLDNAIDYNLPEHGWIRVTVRQEGDKVLLAIRNPGPGIEPEELEKVFHQFYRSPQAISAQPNGNGLGLYLARAIVEQHGGTITCESEVQKETVFTILLPLATKAKPEEAEEQLQSEQQAHN